MQSQQMYTQEQYDIGLLRQKNEELFRTLDRIESHQKWMLSIMGTGFLGLLSLMAHGFHWII